MRTAEMGISEANGSMLKGERAKRPPLPDRRGGSEALIGRRVGLVPPEDVVAGIVVRSRFTHDVGRGAGPRQKAKMRI
jgi:hypothetical protein